MPNDHALTSGGLFEVQEVETAATEAHVVTHVYPEPSGVGGHLYEVAVLNDA